MRDPLVVFIAALLTLAAISTGVVVALDAVGALAPLGDYSGFVGILLGVASIAGAMAAVEWWS